MTTLGRNIRFGFRILRKDLGFTIVALLALTLGIGANTAIFSVVYGALIAPMPYPNPNQLVMVWSKINDNRNGVSAGDYLDWKHQSRVFQDLSAWNGGAFSLSISGHPEMVRARIQTPGFINMVGMPFTLGRDFLQLLAFSPPASRTGPKSHCSSHWLSSRNKLTTTFILFW